MYIMTRYAVWEVLKYFLAALIALTLVITVGMAKRAADDYHLPFLLVFRIMPYLLPEVLGITIPVAMLYAVSGVFGRMTGSNEVVALKSLGISPMAIVWPVLVLAAFCSLGTVWMYEIAATRCRPAIDRVVTESVEEIVYSVLQRTHSCDRNGFQITVQDVQGRKLIRPKITVRGQPGQHECFLSAAEAELRTDPKARQLRIICREVEVDVDRGRLIASRPEQEWPIPIGEPNVQRTHRDRVATWEIPSRIADLEQNLRQLQRLREANKALGIKETPDKAEQVAECRELILRLRTEPYRRWSNGFTCLCFAMVGIPVAMFFRHADVLTNFFLCFLPILAVYYPLLMLGDKLSTSGTLPPISFWMGNVVLSIPAVLLLRWNLRH
ncbi:MAG: LptF/LptG family permease [Thermoguttaceae bacterium]